MTAIGEGLLGIMRIGYLHRLSVIALASVSLARAQGTFQDLDFEEANPSAVVAGNSAAALFPGWQVLVGGTPTTSVGDDVVTIGAPGVEIWDNKNGYTPLQGNYTAFLQSATFPSGGASVGLSQTGIIPAGSQSIDLDASQEEGSSIVVAVGGTSISMVALEQFANYTLYGGNVSEWAGQNATLSITELPPANQEFSPNLLQLDDISFSPGAVPEPITLVLTCIGGVLFAVYRRFAASAKH